MAKSGKEIFNLRNILIFTGIFIVSVIIINGNWIGAGRVSIISGGAPLPDMQTYYKSAQLGAMFDTLGAEGRDAYLVMNGFDFFFAASYGFFYFFLLGFLARKLFPKIAFLRLAGLIGVTGTFFDIVENVAFREFARGVGNDTLALIASIATPLKFGCIMIAMSLMAIGSVSLAIKTIIAKAHSVSHPQSS